jgi:hypothetical protein
MIKTRKGVVGIELTSIRNATLHLFTNHLKLD